MQQPIAMISINMLLGTAVVTVGFWLLWGAAASSLAALWAFAVAAFLWWRAGTITEIWAWSTLLLGLESFAWPVRLMIQLKSASGAPSEEEMGTVLSAVVLGLFASVFWMSFSYGLFKRAWGTKPALPEASPEIPITAPSARRKKRR